jgi:regulator of replication initiation timing
LADAAANAASALPTRLAVHPAPAPKTKSEAAAVIAELRQDNSQQQAMIHTLSEGLRVYKEKSHRLQELVATLEAQAGARDGAAHKRVATLEAQAGLHRLELASMRQQADTAREQAEAAREQADAAREEAAASRLESDQLRTQLAARSAEADELTVELVATMSRNAQDRERLDAQWAELFSRAVPLFGNRRPRSQGMSQGSAQGAKMHAASPMISPGLGTHARTHADRRVSFSEG